MRYLNDVKLSKPSERRMRWGERIVGSHHIFSNDAVVEIINFSLVRAATPSPIR